MVLECCQSLRGRLSASSPRHCWELGSLFDSLTEALTNAADGLSNFLDARHRSAESPLQKVLAAKLLQSSKLAARAATGLSAEVSSLVKVARMAAELYEVPFILCVISLSMFVSNSMVLNEAVICCRVCTSPPASPCLCLLSSCCQKKQPLCYQRSAKQHNMQDLLATLHPMVNCCPVHQLWQYLQRLLSGV